MNTKFNEVTLSQASSQFIDELQTEEHPENNPTSELRCMSAALALQEGLDYILEAHCNSEQSESLQNAAMESFENRGYPMAQDVYDAALGRLVREALERASWDTLDGGIASDAIALLHNHAA